jgi:hypothetical protein
VTILGGLLVYLALTQPPANPLWQVFLIGLGAGSLWLAWRMWRATGQAIELTETELRTSDGTRIAEVARIESLDRGVFAFKPSNGFLLRLEAEAPAAWAPGLWWRLGRRVGVGGMTPGPQTRAMAEVISAMIARR